MYMPLTPSHTHTHAHTHTHTRTHAHTHTHTRTHTESRTPEVRKPLVTSVRAPGGLVGGGSEYHRAVPQVSRNSELAHSPNVSVTCRASSPVGDEHRGETEGGH